MCSFSTSSFHSKNVDELTKYVRSLHDETIGLPPQTSRQLTREEKLEKCVGELVETERTYVKVRGFDSVAFAK